MLGVPLEQDCSEPETCGAALRAFRVVQNPYCRGLLSLIFKDLRRNCYSITVLRDEKQGLYVHWNHRRYYASGDANVDGGDYSVQFHSSGD